MSANDVRAVRALAHPVRLSILDLLQTRDSANATECARETGESAQSCSYHLRTLAKYGFVRRAASDDARETRWELAKRNLAFSTTAGRGATYLAAASTFLRTALEADERAVADFLRHESELDEEWRDAASFLGSSLILTAEEAVELTAGVEKLMRRYSRRRRRRGGARRVHVVFRATPRVDRRSR
jgi:DNA-binding transcriptional ArsR family regulator